MSTNRLFRMEFAESTGLWVARIETPRSSSSPSFPSRRGRRVDPSVAKILFIQNRLFFVMLIENNGGRENSGLLTMSRWMIYIPTSFRFLIHLNSYKCYFYFKFTSLMIYLFQISHERSIPRACCLPLFSSSTPSTSSLFSISLTCRRHFRCKSEDSESS